MGEFLLALFYLALNCAVVYVAWLALAGLWKLMMGQGGPAPERADHLRASPRKSCPACNAHLALGRRTCDACGLRLDSDAGRELRELEITARHIRQLLDEPTVNLVLARIEERREQLLRHEAPALPESAITRERSSLEEVEELLASDVRALSPDQRREALAR